MRNDMFCLVVEHKNSWACNADTMDELLRDVEKVSGKEVKDEVCQWAVHSRKNEKFKKLNMQIINIGNR